MYLDLPVGTGYSFDRDTDEESLRLRNLEWAVFDFVHFMKQFYNLHEKFRGRKTFLFAQDFAAGKYLPGYVQALEDVLNGEFQDDAFEDLFLS